MTKLTKLSAMFIIAVFVFTVSMFADEVKILTSSHCEMCKGKIEKGLLKVKGVDKAVLNLETKVVTVNFDSKKTNPAALLKKVEKMGYTASYADDNTTIEKPAADVKCCKDGGMKCKEMKGKGSKDGEMKCTEMKSKCCKDGDMKCKEMKGKCCKDGDMKCKEMKENCCKEGHKDMMKDKHDGCKMKHHPKKK